MQLSIVHAGFFKLDGGAMFGVVPRQLWTRLNPPDQNNMCTWAMRCLLIQTGDRKILVDTGIGDKQDERFQAHFEPHGDETLLGSIGELGFRAEEITDVLLTHFHFDHVGGAVRYNEKGQLQPTFPNATYWSNEVHYNWAYHPNMREKASFLKENFVPLREQGRLQFIDVQDDDVEWLPGIKVRHLYGHTEAMMMPIIEIGERRVVYCADLLPSPYHIRLPYIMAYDVRPLHTLAEKERLLPEVDNEQTLCFFEHAPRIESGRIGKDEKGRYALLQEISLEAFMSSR